MVTDQELIKRIRSMPDKERRPFMDRVTEYIRACELSRGPDQARSNHWSMNAAKMKRALEFVADKWDKNKEPEPVITLAG